jgi:phosphate transport system protein
MSESRAQFHEELSSLEAAVQEEAQRIQASIARVVDMLQTGSVHQADEIILADTAIDNLYLAVEHDVASLLARQAPVAVDLRLVLAVVHINHNLERIGDQCVNIAKLHRLTSESPIPNGLIHDFTAMASRADEMLSLAMASFANRDLDAARSLVELDQSVNMAHHRFSQRLLDVDDEIGETALRAVLISRALERIGDNCVDIGEQVAYIITGEFVEFTDASPSIDRF